MLLHLKVDYYKPLYTTVSCNEHPLNYTYHLITVVVLASRADGYS